MKLRVKKNVTYDLDGMYVIGTIQESDSKNKYGFFPNAQVLVNRIGKELTSRNLEILIQELQQVKDLLDAQILASTLSEE